MSDDLDEINPKHIAAVFDASDDVDVLQRDLAHDLARQAVRVGGIIRRHLTGAHGTRLGRRGHYVRARDLDFRASRQRSVVYKLDTNGLAKTAAIAFRALRDLADLIEKSILPAQTTGGRPRAEFVDPVARDVPLLTAVLVRCLAAWRTLPANIGKLLFAIAPNRSAMVARYLHVPSAQLGFHSQLRQFRHCVTGALDDHCTTTGYVGSEIARRAPSPSLKTALAPGSAPRCEAP
ncbi:DUF2478 domain-containing protein [Bradyrhizobium sp. USDA 4454]